MGSYLIIDGKQNNTKSISYPMINLIREILPERDDLNGAETFLLTKEEVAGVLYGIAELLGEEGMLEDYIDSHSGDYGMHGGFREIKGNFGWIHRCFSRVLSEMVICDKKKIVCRWE